MLFVSGGGGGQIGFSVFSLPPEDDKFCSGCVIIFCSRGRSCINMNAPGTSAETCAAAESSPPQGAKMLSAEIIRSSSTLDQTLLSSNVRATACGFPQRLGVASG